MSQKSSKRETTTKILFEALKESKEINDENLIKTLASDLESAVYNLVSTDSTREYRDKINFLKMRLKGSNYSYVRDCLFNNQVSPD